MSLLNQTAALLRAGPDPKTVQPWGAALSTLLADAEPDALTKWLARHGGALDGPFVGELAATAYRLLRQTDLGTTTLLFRLELLVTGALNCPVAGEYPDALRLVLQAITEEGTGPRTVGAQQPADVYKRLLNYRGCCLAERGEYAAAVEHLDLVLKLDPAFAPAYCNRARARLELGQIPAAWADCEALVATDPDYPEGRVTYHLGVALRRLKETQAGSVGELAEEHRLLGVLRLYDRPLKPREQGRAVTLEGIADQLNHIGVVLGTLGDYRGAIAAFRQLLEMTPDYTRALFNLGRAHALLGEHAAAVEQFSACLALRPGDPEVYAQRAESYRALGDARRAADDERAARSGAGG
jgi:tetratricopeptide (TPR) repeat protein